MTAPTPAARPKRQRLFPRVGWFKIYRADTSRIREWGESDGRVSTAVLVSVWVAMIDIANEERSATFTRSIGIIWKRAGVSRRHTSNALAALEALGMLTKETHRAKEPGKFFDANTWTLHSSNMTPLGKGCTVQRLHCASKQAIHLHNGYKKSSTKTKEEKRKEEPSPLSTSALAAPVEGTASTSLPTCCTWS